MPELPEPEPVETTTATATRITLKKDRDFLREDLATINLKIELAHEKIAALEGERVIVKRYLVKFGDDDEEEE